MNPSISMRFDSNTILYLRELRATYPTIDSALAKVAVLSSSLTLPKGAIHVISDVHGEYKKLRHVVNNASGSLRPLVLELFGDELSSEEQIRLLSFIYYPRESFLHLSEQLAEPHAMHEVVEAIVHSELVLIRALAQNYPLHRIAAVLPTQYAQVFRELILSPQFERTNEHFRAIIRTFAHHDRELDLLRLTARIVRNLAISELVVAGDLGDRGQRIDKSIDFIMKQPNVSVIWGNHDTSWMGACLGHGACIATVVRMSLRYGRITQLEEGYGIPLEPVAKLVSAHYADDQAEYFECKDVGDRDGRLLARMQKAMAIIQFKLEGQLIARNPHYNLQSRNLISRINQEKVTVSIAGKDYPLRDTFLPTLNPASPLELNAEETECMRALTESFVSSPTLWKHMTFLARKGSMAIVRDRTLIFHGCLPCDEKGAFLSLEIDGVPRRGLELFDAIEISLQRAFISKRQADLDLLWYLWCGPLSPLFGKDKIATFELYFVADTSTHKEVKNPYFGLIHEVEFCDKVLEEFGVDRECGLIVNGHVPVKIEAGESPVKRSGKAVTIDGAFSEAYGDKGYTLVLQPERTYLALHHHFQSVEDTIKNGTDMIPETQELRSYTPPRRIADTEEGRDIEGQIALLELLIRAYRENKIEQIG